MKRLVFLLLLAIPFSLKAESASVGGSFRGLNNGDSSILIGDNEAQDLSNVDITKNGYGISKRAGYAQFKTIGTSTWGVRGGYYFTDQSGNNKIIHANGTSVSYSLNGAAYTGFYTTATAGSYWDFVDSQGVLYGANHNHDPPFTYNGTTLIFSTSVPRGSQVEAYPDRLVVAGSTANPNTIYFSQSGDFSDFTIGRLENEAPYSEYYGLPGQLVQAIKYSLGELLIWTKTSVGRYVGSNQYDGKIDDISSTIGTDQPSTVVTDLGITYFQGADRHFYSYDGQGLTRISQPISGSVDGMIKGESKTWQITSQSDFSLGTFAIGLSSTISPGDVTFSDGILIDDFSDGDYSVSPVWTPFGVSGATVSINSNRLAFEGTASGPDSAGVYTPWTFSNVWSVKFSPKQIQNSEILSVAMTTATPTGVNSLALPTGTSCYALTIANILGGAVTIKLYNGNTLLASSGDLGAVPSNIEMSLSDTGNLIAYSNGAAVLNVTDTNLTRFSHLSVQAYILTSGLPLAIADDFYYKALTGTYQSQSYNVGTAITSWGGFYVNNSLSGGTVTYAVYTDTNSSLIPANSSTWTSSQTITNGSLISLATAPYVAWTAKFNRNSTLQEQSINDVSISWFEGTNPHNWGSVDKDHRILWSVAEGTATVPNTTYIYDPRFQSWLKYSAPFDAPAKVGNSVYFGGVSTGVVYQWPSGNTDNGSAIMAYWKSKDFIAPDPYIEKDFLSTSIVAKSQTGSNLDVTYTINTTSAITKNLSLTDTTGSSLKRINFNLPSGKYGTFLSLKFGNDDADAPFEFYSFKYDYKPRPWRVMQ
jgi:hypothetical protein